MLENAIVEQSFTENEEINKLQTVLAVALNIIEKETESVWVKIYQGKIPPAFLYNDDKPMFFKHASKALLEESEKFFLKNSKIPISNFFLGLLNEYCEGSRDKAYEIFNQGAEMNEPFCYFKLAEILIRKNELANRKQILYYLLKSFMITGIEAYRYLPDSLNMCQDGFSHIDSFWYLTYYFDTHYSEFMLVYDEFFENEKLGLRLKQAILYALRNLHNHNEHMGILQSLQEITLSESDKSAALHLCMFTSYLSKTINVNVEYVISLLKVLADNGNIYAAERLAIILENKNQFSMAIEYYNVSARSLLPTSLFNLGNLYCSVKNDAKSVQLEKAYENWKKASYFGIYYSIEFLKLLKVRKEFSRLFLFANYSYSCGLYGAELFIGECYEKGQGVDANLRIALSFYINGLRKHREGTGFLYRIARTYEKLGFKKYDEFYKICFNLYQKLYEKDKQNSNNMWILDAYRISSMYAIGRGVKKDIPKSITYLDIILQADIDIQTSSFLCLFYVTIKRKKELISLTNNFSSILSIDDINVSKSNRSREIFSTGVPLSKNNTSPKETNQSVGVNDNVSMTSVNHSSIALSASAVLIDEVMDSIKDTYFNKRQKKKQQMDIILIEGFIENIKKFGGRVINIDDIEFGQLIGNGKFSKVYEGHFNNIKVAIKDFNLQMVSIKSIFEEIHLQISLQDHKINKVLYLGLSSNPLRICSVNKYMKYNLRYVINELQLNILQKLFISKQISEALLFLHSQSPVIIHRDIKPENLLMDDEFNIELCDFGVVNAISDNKGFTLRYAAPEIVKGKEASTHSDIWSFGLVLYNLFHEKQAWDELKDEQIVERIKRDKLVLLSDFNDCRGDEASTVIMRVNSLINKCTSCDPLQRPSINKILEEIFTLIYEYNLSSS
jgi:TPR repeat protein